MNGNEIFLSTTNLSRLEKSIDRIEGIFDVNLRINVQENGKGNNNTGVSGENAGTFGLRISTKSSPESVKKTIKYIHSFIGDDPELKRTSQKFNHSEFNMLLKKHDLVEKISQAYLEFLADMQEIRITGSYEDVCLAQSVMKMMLEEAANQNSESIHAITGPDSYSRKFGDTECLDKEQVDLCSLQSMENKNVSVDGEALSLSDRSRTTGQNGLQAHVDYSHLQDKRPCSQGNLLTGDTCRSEHHHMYDNANHTIFSNTSLDSHKFDESDISPPSCHLDLSSQNALSDSDNELDKLHAEPGYSDKLEFAIKLGYTEENLLVALRKLGHGSGQNELLSELIKLDAGKHSSEEKRVFSEDDLFSSNEPSDLLISTSDRFDEGYCGEDGCILRPIVIDGSNVAMSHGNKEVFSCRGIMLAVDWFRQYGHKEITVFVPQWRKEISRPDAPIKDQDILTDLEKEKILVFTPARRIGGKRVVCYDDRYILKLAVELGGIVVSNDNYRDLLNENPEYRKVVEERLLMYSFVNDRFMPPDDPLGRHGPSLENFLRKEPTVPEPLPPPCPYGSKKCTYGNKCKFYHPERGNMPHKSVTEKLAEQAKQKIQEVRIREASGKTVDGEKKQSSKKNKIKQTLQRTGSLNTADDGSAGNVATKADRDEQWRLYEEKLNHLRKQFELAEISNAETDNTAVSNPEPVLAHPAYIDPLPLPAHKVGSTSSSPIPRVQTPTQIIKLKQEQLISGHLLLAKKLSDESNDHNFKLNENGDSEDEDSTHQAVTDQSGHLAVAGQIGRSVTDHSGQFTVHSEISRGAADHLSVADQIGQVTNDQSRQLAASGQPEHLSKQNTEGQQLPWHTWSPVGVHQEKQPMPTLQQHLKLSRQMSLSGNRDTRIYPQFQHQMSCDPQLSASTDSGYQTRSLSMHRRGPGVQMYSAAEPERISSFPLTSTDIPVFYSHPGHGGRNDPACCSVRSDEIFHSGDHSFVPNIFHASNYEQMPSRQHGHHGMVRQNSNSDSQLHMIGVSDPDPYNTGYAYSQANVPYGMDMATTDPGSYSTHQQQPYFRSTSMVLPQCRQTLASRSAKHYSDGRFAGGFEQPAQVNNPYMHSPQMYSQPQHQYMESDQIQQQFSSQQVHRLPNYQQGGGCVQPQSPCVSDQYVASPQIAGQQPLTPSVWSELPPNSLTSPMRTPMPEEKEIKPTDTRYNLYYHLCGLFSEPKVRAVMNLHPNETNPRELCAYIIGAK